MSALRSIFCTLTSGRDKAIVQRWDRAGQMAKIKAWTSVSCNKGLKSFRGLLLGPLVRWHLLPMSACTEFPQLIGKMIGHKLRQLSQTCIYWMLCNIAHRNSPACLALCCQHGGPLTSRRHSAFYCVVKTKHCVHLTMTSEGCYGLTDAEYQRLSTRSAVNLKLKGLFNIKSEVFTWHTYIATFKMCIV